jgi:glycosyltransferase involved in cell wall biosynthesis
MSTLKPSKNIEGLLYAWKLIEKNYPEIQLVVAGKKGWLFESIFGLTEKLNLKERVVFTDFVEEEDKPVLIANATCFVLPSFWEGFGLDVLSSMACGVPVVVSNRGSLPEVVGDAGQVVDPDSSEDISKGIEKVLEASNLQIQKMKELGKKRAEQFDWEKTARDTVHVLRELL